MVWIEGLVLWLLIDFNLIGRHDCTESSFSVWVVKKNAESFGSESIQVFAKMPPPLPFPGLEMAKNFNFQLRIWKILKGVLAELH